MKSDPKFRVRQHVGIIKEKMKFTKCGEQKYTTEIFRIIKVIRRTPRHVYGLEYLNRKVIDGQFYGEALTGVRITTHRPGFGRQLGCRVM